MASQSIDSILQPLAIGGRIDRGESPLMKQVFRGIISNAHTQLLARDVWPTFVTKTAIEYSQLHDAMVAWGHLHGLEFEADSVIGWWVEQQLLEVSPDHKQFRLKERAVAQLAEWEEENRLWNSGSNKPMPLNKRLVAGEPARNVRKIKDLIGASTVTAIHDPYTRAASLETILKLADIETRFSASLRILGTPLTSATEKGSLISFLKDINTERNSRWEVRTYVAAPKPHRRFLVLQDGAVVTCGMSLNHINKDEVLDREPAGSEYAKHDSQFFENNWKKATVLS